MSDLMQFLDRGGPALWVIAGLSIITLGLILWKLWRLSLMGAWRRDASEASRVLRHGSGAQALGECEAAVCAGSTSLRSFHQPPPPPILGWRALRAPGALVRGCRGVGSGRSRRSGGPHRRVSAPIA